MTSRQLRILVMVNGRVGSDMSGPEIRGWEIARALGRSHSVTAATWDSAERTEDGVRIVPLSRRRLLAEGAEHDVVIGPSLPPYLLASLQRTPTAVVTDQYDPVDLEMATLGDGMSVARAVKTQVAHRGLQLRVADMVICAGERQRARLQHQLDELRRSGSGAPEVTILPMGIAEQPRASASRPLRERFGLAADDFVVFWWGSVWRWFDAETAVRAVAMAAAEDPRIKLVITASPPPHDSRRRMLATDSVIALAESLGVLGTQVLLLEDWVPFAERHTFLQDADLGISLHRETPEAELAARARYMDYLWAGVPCVLAEGDEIARDFGVAGFASIVPPGDASAVASTLLAHARDPGRLRSARVAGRELADRYRWSTLVSRWMRELEAAVAAGDGARGRTPVVPAVASYYGRRLADRVLSAATRG